MEKIYQPQKIEQNCYEQWESKGYFQTQGKGSPYCIMLPPPNVTGTLHMGHGFQQVIMDALIRYHRMDGKKTLWQVGTDHAGIATQMVVERQLSAENISRQTLGREKFVEKVWDWKQKSGDTILKQMRRLGVSADWSRERFTMDEGLSHAVKTAFIQLYEEGLIYRGQRLVNWDPKLMTAISDLEVVNQEEQGSLWFIRYPLVNESTRFVTIATTRPETILADSAIAVHPEDERYQDLIGQKVFVPIINRAIPIIGDEFVEPKFGTGCVKITPAHDFNDYEMGQRHQLPMINIFTGDGCLNEEVPEVYQGLNRFVARKKIVKELTQNALIEKIEPHTMNVPRGDRSGEILEPFLTKQWYVRTEPLAQSAVDVVKSGEITFFPENWQKTYFQWMDNIQDWCISRQLWWGHRIPAWYDDKGNCYVGTDEQQIRTKYRLPESLGLTQDDDVLDTWFSSALWPFATLGWPKNSEELSFFYPTDTLVTGFDIIFFWVARMIMLSLKFTQKVPFKTVYITGLIRDSQGQKMSKTKGNTLDPIDIIDGIDKDSLIKKRTDALVQESMAQKVAQETSKEFPQGIESYGTDALRMTFYALSSPSMDIRFDFARLASSYHFCNKLWNAARFVLLNYQAAFLAHEQTAQKNECGFNNQSSALIDQWILAQLKKVTAKVRMHMKTYRFDLAIQVLYEFVWHDYCDWYLELVKISLNSTLAEAQKSSTYCVLLEVLEAILRLLHPFLPFITEAIWQQIKTQIKQWDLQKATIMLCDYPKEDEFGVSPKLGEQDSEIIKVSSEAKEQSKKIDDVVSDASSVVIDWMISLVSAIRTVRSENNINPGKYLSIMIRQSTEVDRLYFQQTQRWLMLLAKISDLEWLTEQQAPKHCSVTLVNKMEVFVSLAGVIDKAAEVERLNKQIDKIKLEINKCQEKLSNPKFVEKAPQAVVEQEKERLVNFQQQLDQLSDQINQYA